MPSDDEPGGDKGVAQSLIEALYRDFLLRDFMAKIVPGGIVMLATASATSSSSDLFARVSDLSLPIVAFLAGIAWIVGFGIQGLGEAARLVRQHPKKYDDADLRYGKRIKFKSVASHAEISRVERYSVIKEASGNGGAAALVSCVIVVVSKILCSGGRGLRSSDAIQLVVVLVVSLFLIYTNRTHAKKEYEYLERVIRQRASGN